MLEWLNIDEIFLCQFVFEGYVEMDIRSLKEKNNIDIDKDINFEKKVSCIYFDILNGEIFIIEDDMDVCFKYGEIGVCFDLIVNDILKKSNFDEYIEYVLKDYIKKV